MLTLSQGDFRQCLPIVPRAPQSQIVAATLPFSAFWKDVRILRLSTNMRLLAHAGQMDATEQANAEHFAKWLLNVGDGTAAEPDNPFKVTIPPGMNPMLTSKFQRTDFVLQNCDYYLWTTHRQSILSLPKFILASASSICTQKLKEYNTSANALSSHQRM
jgi:hypothetical protein